MSEFNKVGEYTNLRFERKFEDLKLTVREINPKYTHDLTGKNFSSEDELNNYIEELISKRSRFLTLSKTLDEKELKAIYGDEVKVLNNKPTEIKKFTVKSQYDYKLRDTYFDIYETFDSEGKLRDYLSEKFGLFVGNFDLVGDFNE